jgi:paraquat-inducible protein A
MGTKQYNRAVQATLVACSQCDLLQRLPDLDSGAAARCPRCNNELWRRRQNSLDRTLALTLAAAVLYIVANSVPMLGLTVVGREASTTVLEGCQQLWRDGEQIVAGLVLVAAVVAPALQIAFMLAIAIGARRERVPRWAGTLLRHHPTTRTWSMIEVMLLGVMVALIKIAELATVIPGMALFVLGALVFILTWIQSAFDPREVWERIEWAGDAAPGTAEEDRMVEVTS